MSNDPPSGDWQVTGAAVTGLCGCCGRQRSLQEIRIHQRGRGAVARALMTLVADDLKERASTASKEIQGYRFRCTSCGSIHG